MNGAHKSIPLGWRERFILAGVVPLVLLLTLEVAARGLLWIGVGAPRKQEPMRLEMPTWMMNDANAMSRKAPSADALDWLRLFQSGEGYRVRLTPNISVPVKNTFSLIPADEQRRYVVTSNSIGFRGPELTPVKNPNTFRVLVFGDSSSFGWGVDAKDSWSVLLGNELAQRYPGLNVEIGNFAIPGDSSAYGRLVFDTFAKQYQSDLTIFGFGANDAKPVPTSHTSQVSRFQQRSGLLHVATALRWSGLYRLLEALAAPPPPTVESMRNVKRVPAVSMADYGSNLRYMTSTAKSLGNTNSLLLTLCTPPNYAKRARTVAGEQDALFFNGQARLLKALPEIRTGKLYPEYVEKMQESYPKELAANKLFYITSDGCHPNELGHRFVADNLTEIIAKSRIVDPK